MSTPWKIYRDLLVNDGVGLLSNPGILLSVPEL